MYQEDIEVYEPDDGEAYEIVESEAPYITQKRWKNLEGRLLPVPASYARTLEADNDRLRAENLHLKEAIARSGNSFFMADANRWRQRITYLEMKCAKLEGEICKLQAEKEPEAISRLSRLLRHRKGGWPSRTLPNPDWREEPWNGKKERLRPVKDW